MAGAVVLGEFGIEGFRFRSKDVVGVVANPLKGSVDVGPHRIVQGRRSTNGTFTVPTGLFDLEILCQAKDGILWIASQSIR